MRRRRVITGVGCALALLLAFALPAEATNRCFGPFTLSSSGRATPVPTPAVTPTAGAWPTATPFPVNIFTTHTFFVSCTDAGDNLDAAPFVVFKGLGPGDITTDLAVVACDTGNAFPGATPTPAGGLSGQPAPVGALDGPGVSVTDVAVKGIYPELHGCINCSVSVGWCSSD